MPFGRLLAAVIFCVTSAFAQQQPLASNRAPDNLFENYFSSPPAASPAEPWRIIPEQPQTDSSLPSSNKLLNDQANAVARAEQARRVFASIPFDPNTQHPWIKFSPDGKILAVGVADDVTCYSIRSYQVARDNKDSDAVHPVSESTCQPAGRYGVHAADQHLKLSNGEDFR
jgi:hypothetical protein